MPTTGGGCAGAATARPTGSSPSSPTGWSARWTTAATSCSGTAWAACWPTCWPGASARGGGPRPAALAVAAFGAPHLPRPDLGSTGDDRELARRLYEIGGIPQWLFRNPEWLEPFLGLVRDDAGLCASYRHRPQERPLGVPVHVFGGQEDRLFPPEAVRPWTEVAEEVEVVFHPGGHFLLAEDSGRIRNAVFGIAALCRQYA
ncbi:thioesterase II family protein [Nocardiopsis suaedae]|uniref:thioesterase II family protein n=1 Tax=Nocardiopsis suaedae TaxID=3018444 RepID=UPI0038CD269B